MREEKNVEASARRLADLESVVKRGLPQASMYINVGAALREIKENELFRKRGFDGWGQYCEKCLHLSRIYAFHLIESSKFAMRMLSTDNIAPPTERQARALRALNQNHSRHYTDEDAVPELVETPISQTGDLWVLGDDRLLVDDATNRDHLVRLMGGDGADLIVTDPPYGVDYRGGPNQQGQSRPMINDDLKGVPFEQFLSNACRNLLEVSRGAIYIFMASSEIDTLKRVFVAAGGHWGQMLIWDKHHFTMNWSDYQRQYEPFLYGWREGTNHFWCGARNQSDVWKVNKPVANDLHPTQKPVELIERAVLNSSQRNEIVLDPFGGSGSTLVACEKTGRRARLMEIDPRYADVIVRRWEAHTGKKAILDGDGRTFDELRRTVRRTEVDRVSFVPGHCADA